MSTIAKPTIVKQIGSRLILSLAACCSVAHADEPQWWNHIGGAKIITDASATLRAGGVVVPDAGSSSSNNTALILETGYRITPDWSASFSAGTPPTTTAKGTGSAQAFGKIGEITYAPVLLNLQYWFAGYKGLRPYVGAGPVYYLVLRSKDGALQQLESSNGWGYDLQAGFEYALSSRYGLFFDVKKIFVDTQARGVMPAFGTTPLTADIKLAPWCYHAGLSISF